MEFSKCAFCDNEALFLCDFEHGWDSWGQFGRRRCVNMNGKAITCDAPLCSDCRTKIGYTSFFDSYDYCPIHKSRHGTLRRELTTGQAESIRLKDWKFKYYQKQLEFMLDLKCNK